LEDRGSDLTEQAVNRDGRVAETLALLRRFLDGPVGLVSVAELTDQATLPHGRVPTD